MTKSCATIIITSIFFISVVLPLAKVRAQVELPFGGLANFPIPCTCSLTVAVWFTPLYLGGPAAVTGPLVYSPHHSLCILSCRRAWRMASRFLYTWSAGLLDVCWRSLRTLSYAWCNDQSRNQPPFLIIYKRLANFFHVSTPTSSARVFMSRFNS